MKELTPKQEKFTHLFIKTGDASAAYREAYNADNMKRTTINRKATEVMQVPKVAARIRHLQKEISHSMRIDTEQVLNEFARIGFSDIRKLFDERGNLVPVKELDRDTAAAIASFKVRLNANGDQIAEVKLWPKLAALESLSKHLGLFEKDNRQKSTALAEILKEIDNGGLPAPPSSLVTAGQQ